MITLHKGDCEHCHNTYRYTLWDALFGEYSYAYCDTCGMLATIYDTSENAENLPATVRKYRQMDASWEPFLASCDCGGHFKKGAAPRCVHCKEPLSAEYAAAHISRNVKGAAKSWVWQGNWEDRLCMAISDPKAYGNLRHTVDPFLQGKEAKSGKGKGVLGLGL